MTDWLLPRTAASVPMYLVLGEAPSFSSLRRATRQRASRSLALHTDTRRQQDSMTAAGSVSAFVAQARSQGGGTVVREHPKLDIDLYVQNYTGRTRFDRLLFIGKTCAPLCVDALKAAVAEAKQTTDVARYKEACDCVGLVAPDDPEAQRDDAWIDRTEAENKAETLRLETELKGYKNNLIKESIRDLGKHFESIGKLQEATEAYGRMRQDVSTAKHIIDCGKRLANVSLQRRDWSTALNTVVKTAGVQCSDEKSTHAFIKIVSGISLLGMGHYDEAAQSFLHANCDVPPSEYAHVASPNDVAIYGGLTALATMERDSLQLQVLENHVFRIFLDQEPHIRKAISLFINGRYTACLSILESARPDYLLDIYLHKHIPALYSRIRSKCIVQYFAPFSCATIDSLDAAFGQAGRPVEPELVKLIREGPLKARIDAREKLLVAVRPDPRVEMQLEALGVARQYEQEAKERLRRISLVAASLEIVGVNRKQGTGLGADESWYEDGANLVPASGAPGDGQG